MQKKNYIIKIFIQTLDILYKFCDNFGYCFKPFIQIHFNEQDKIINIIDYENLNISNNERSVSDMLNSKYLIENERKNSNSYITKQKTYSFESVT